MNYIVGTALSIFGLQLLNKGIEQFSNLNEKQIVIGGVSNYQNDFVYSENKRLNLNFGKYPPCFNTSSEAQKIFDIIDMNGKKKTFEKLFDIYSILLCQKYHAGYKDCNPIMLDERMNDVKKMIPKDVYLNEYKNKLNKYVQLNKSKVSKLILYSFYLIEQEMKKVTDEQIISLNRNFYFSTFKELFTLCDSY
jgi:hypothetical protein